MGGRDKTPKPRIYLAGPISGCNPDQVHVWRNELKAEFANEFDFVDPTDNLIWEKSGFEVARADQEAIRSSDAVLANMWKESIGTAFGIAHAHSAGRIVAVCDPNLIGSRMIAFYADAVERSLPATLDSIRAFLAAERRVKGVIKSDGKVEAFNRQKLAKSVRRACLAAGQSDMVPARAVVAYALRNLLGTEQTAITLKSSAITEAVWQALAELGSDPVHEADYDLIRAAWEQYSNERRSRKQALITLTMEQILVHDKPLAVPIRKSGTHSVIWGSNIGNDAAKIFEDILRVEGITEIRFGPFRNTGAPPARPHVRLQASKTQNIIEGTCYDKGPKGTLQTFQIRVADDSKRDAILLRLRHHLTERGHIRSTVTTGN